MQFFMGFTGSHNDMVFICLCNSDLSVFGIKSDAQQTHNPALSGFSHLFFSIPSCTLYDSLAYFPFFCPIV